MLEFHKSWVNQYAEGSSSYGMNKGIEGMTPRRERPLVPGMIESDLKRRQVNILKQVKL